MDSLKFLAVFAHPDDESMGMGATLVKYSAGRADARLVCATHGGRGWFNDPKSHLRFDSLAQTRTFEYDADAAYQDLKNLSAYCVYKLFEGLR